MIGAVIFDKDGTLFDFSASWGGWVGQILPLLAACADQRRAVADALGYNLETGRFAKSSVVIAGTPAQIAHKIHDVIADVPVAAITDVLNAQAAQAPMLPAVDLPRVLGDLRAMGLRLGLASNDAEAPARAHLSRAQVLPLFDFIAGSDSGFGGKPAAGQLVEFARQIDLPPAQIAMVGDSLHDLHAARAAGMVAVAVLTGVAGAADLAPHADVVLPDIGHLAAWLARA